MSDPAAFVHAPFAELMALAVGVIANSLFRLGVAVSVGRGTIRRRVGVSLAALLLSRP